MSMQALATLLICSWAITAARAGMPAGWAEGLNADTAQSAVSVQAAEHHNVEDSRAGRALQQVPNGWVLPTGWWDAMGTTYNNKAAWCGLRDFPPITNGYGTARLVCYGNYNHYYMWRVIPVSGSGPIISFSQAYLAVWNPYFKFCRLARANQIICGVNITQATLFQVETASGAVVFNPANDKLYLKANNQYCRLRGNGYSTFVYCEVISRAAANTFAFPPSSYGNVTLTNLGVNLGCGGNAIPFNEDAYAYVNCTQPASTANTNYVTAWMLAFKTPPTLPILTSNTAYALKAYDSFLPYRDVVWYRNETTGLVYLKIVDLFAFDPKQWFIIQKIGTRDQQPLASGDRVAIRHEQTGKYCGIGATQYIVCDKFRPRSALYQYTININ